MVVDINLAYSATIIIFIFSKLHNNSSIYDPFWHVAPIPIVIFMCFDNYFIYKDLLVIFPFLFWSLRLTYNWYKIGKIFTMKIFVTLI